MAIISTPDSVHSATRASFAILASRCPLLSALPPPWAGLRPDNDALGPVTDPGATVAALRGQVPDATLVRAGVLRIGPDNHPDLAPELVNPAGALVVLRDQRIQPLAVLTARGCLPRKYCPVRAALKDTWTAARVAEWGALFASPHIREVVLLRALGLPATVSAGMANSTAARFAALDARFAPPAVVPGPGPVKPLLVFVDWSVRAISGSRPPALAHTLTGLAAARRHLDLAFAGLTVWRPAPADLEALRFRLRLGALDSVRDLLRSSADRLVDFAAPAEGPSAPPPYPAALAELLAALDAGRGGGADEAPVEAALAAYEAAVRRDLTTPQMNAALASWDPVERLAGVELANVAGLLHGVTPVLHELLAAGFAGALTGGTEPIPTKVLNLYLKLSARSAALTGTLTRMRK